MKRVNKLLCAAVCACAPFTLFAQEAEAPAQEVKSDHFMQVSSQGRLGVEAGTEFVMDMNDKSAGLETNVGIELYLPLFDKADRGAVSENGYMQPGVRLIVKDMCFQWMETYFAKGGNYEQDNVNSWASRPLVLSYGDISADVVWKNFYFQVAGTTNPMEVSQASLNSIFDDVMDTDDRWYIKKDYALYSKTRYNKQGLPLLGTALTRDFVDPDYKDDISGQLGFGVEFSKFTALAKAASLYNGRDNDNNAWLFGLDSTAYPVENMKIEANVLAGVNCDADLGENPFAAGISADYKIPLVKKVVMKPFVGFDYNMDLENTSNKSWELGAGTYIYFRGEDYLASHREVDYDEIVPVGISLGANLAKLGDADMTTNLVFSAFEIADRRALIPNLGYFAQFEMSAIASDNMHTAVCGQLEYIINGKFLPYVYGKYAPELSANGEHFTGKDIVTAKVGCYMTPVQYFSIDLNYSLDFITKGKEDSDIQDKGALGIACVIRL